MFKLRTPLLLYQRYQWDSTTIRVSASTFPL